MSDIQSILGELDRINATNVYGVYVPSLKREVMFKELTTAQQKAIIKTIIDNPIHNSAFIFTIRDILQQNCAENVQIDTLTIIDKLSICLKMRQKSVGNEYDYVFKGTEKTKKINIQNVIDKISKIEIRQPKLVETEIYEILCAVPSIKTEYDMESEFKSASESLKIENSEDLKTIIGDTFMNEVVKYIKTIKVKSTGNIINLGEYSFNNRILILEKIGNSALKKILEYISDVNMDYADALRVDFILENEEEIEKYKRNKLTGVLEASSSFFITS